jgi:uncharacterized protein (DUF433 family)
MWKSFKCLILVPQLSPCKRIQLRLVWGEKTAYCLVHWRFFHGLFRSLCALSIMTHWAIRLPMFCLNRKTLIGAAMNASWKDRIVSTSDTLVGKPRIKGTRISVEFLLERLADGWSYAAITASYPNVSELDIQAALAFVSEIYREESFVAEQFALAA